MLWTNAFFCLIGGLYRIESWIVGITRGFIGRVGITLSNCYKKVELFYFIYLFLNLLSEIEIEICNILGMIYKTGRGMNY